MLQRILIGVAIAVAAVWTFTPGDRERWVIRDGSVACTAAAELIDIQYMNSAASKRDQIETAVKANKCIVLFANDRVRISELSKDGSRAMVQNYSPAGYRWMFIADLKRTNPRWISWPWW